MKSRVHTKPHAYTHFNGTPITWLFCPDYTNDPKLRLTCWTFTFFGGEFCYAQSNRQNGQYPKNIVIFIFVIRDWSKSIGGGGGWAGAFGNVVVKKHMTHPLPSVQK